MSSISINLPEAVVSAVTERAHRNGFPDVAEYVSQIITRVSERQSEVERLAIEGVASGPSEPWNADEMDAIRKDLRSKHGN